MFCEVKRRTTSFSNCFINTKADTADERLRSFAFPWNQPICNTARARGKRFFILPN
jgi:hypothetical protein